MKHCSLLWLLVFLLLHWPGAAWATAGPPATGRPLAEALNPDGTLRAGAAGSFDARAFRMGTAPDGRPVFRPAGALGAGDERWADGFGQSNGVSRSVSAVVQSGANIYVGGYFQSAAGVAANYVAKWDGTAWSPLGTGVNGTVKALAVAPNGDLYAGGEFITQAGGVAANGVAKWNGTVWSPLGTGVNGSVLALAVAPNGDLYAGGRFNQAGGMAANNIAKWDGTAWSPLGAGVNHSYPVGTGVVGFVFALAVANNGDVYAGGYFNQAGGVAANHVAKWNGTAWSPLGAGVDTPVNALVAVPNGDLYVGGSFTQAGGTAANRIAKWNGTVWSPLGTGVNDQVKALAVAPNGEVYICGNFNQAGGVVANYVAKWNGTAWSPLGAGAGNGVSSFTEALAVTSNGEIYTGSGLYQAGLWTANSIAKWNGTVWGPVGTGVGNAVFGQVSALAVASTGEVYIGGEFIQAGGLLVNRVAKWNGTAWSPLGTGVNGSVKALAVDGSGNVYAGGGFTQAGGVTANRVAKWNGTAWSPLGTGMDATVNALAVAPNGDLYAGGDFFRAGGVAANGVAKWNGTIWSSMGSGTYMNSAASFVRALAVASNGEVYAGGGFTQAGGVTANYVAKWNGTAWSPLGAGVDSGTGASVTFVNALAVASTGEVYVGGRFTQAGGVGANNVAKWNGTVWSSLGPGAGDIVSALAVASTGDVYVGTSSSMGGGVMGNFIAKWNGAAWSGLGTGLNNAVFGIACGSTGQIYTGGYFSATGDGSKVQIGFAIYGSNAPLATTAARAIPAALFPNPAHGTATLRLPADAVRLPLTLTDALGRLVRQFPAPAGPEAVLDLRGLPAGVYLVRCGELTQRLVVE